MIEVGNIGGGAGAIIEGVGGRRGPKWRWDILYVYPFIVGALPHYIRENAHIFANVVQPLTVILSFHKPQILIFKAQISPK